MENTKKKQFSRVTLVLSRGLIFGNRAEIIIFFTFIGSVISVTGVFAARYLYDKFLDLPKSVALKNLVAETVLVGVGYITAAVLLVLIAIICYRTTNLAIKCLDDAIETTGFAQKIIYYPAPEVTPCTKIQVNFTIDGVLYRRLNGSKNNLNKGGFSPFWSFYLNKEIKIMYSPKYDEVLILKDEKKKK